MTSTVSSKDPFGDLDRLLTRPSPQVVVAPPLPEAHPAEAGVFARHEGIPGHRQEALTGARVVSVGGGGLMGPQTLGLVRAGVKYLTIIEPDRVERHNLPRQLFAGEDIGAWKASALARNLLSHSTNEAVITAIALPFEEAVRQHPLPCDLLLVGVDNNGCRLAAAQYARARGIPAVFTMLSRDGNRFHAFLQGAYPTDPCLHCALPDLDPEAAAPCASASVVSCMAAATHGLFFAFRALMGWPDGIVPFNWREGDLLGVAPDRTGRVSRRGDCATCGG